MENKMSNVNVAGSYGVFFWISAIIWTTVVAVFTAGFGILLFPILVWYKKMVVNRTKIIFENDTNKLTFQRGRWLVKDDDVVPVRAIDNVKLNRSLMGKIFGWCDILIDTRSETYKIKYVSTKAAEQFRDAFLALV